MDKILRYTAFGLLALVVIALMAATVMDRQMGHEWTQLNVYGSWWFVALWTGLGLTSATYLFKRQLYKRPAVFVIHAAFALILVGALVTHLFGVQGNVHLRMGERVSRYFNSESELVERLPFSLTLSDFRTELYPGTQSPMDYVSVVEAEDVATKHELRISMNNIGEYCGWRFYQSGYDTDMQGTTLSVAYDPWGIGITYTGYGLLVLAMLLFMVVPRYGYRRLFNKSRTSAMVLLMFSTMMAQGAEPRVLPRETAQRFGELYTYYNGRVCPVQTVAIDFTTKLYGHASYRDYSPEQVLTGWALFASSWVDEPMIKVKGGELSRYTGTDSNMLSYADFFNGSDYVLQEVLRENHDASSTIYRAVREADERLNILQMLFAGELLKIYPYRTPEGVLTWWAQGQNPPAEMGEERWLFVKRSMDYIGELAAMQQYSELDSLLVKVRKYQVKEAQGLLPTDWQMKAERWYNGMNYIRHLSMVLLTVGIVMFIMSLVVEVRRRELPRWCRYAALLIVVLSAVYVLALQALRVVVAGHLPLANGHETMLSMSLCAMVLTICLWRRVKLMLPFGLMISGLMMLVAMIGQQNPQITLLMPVLSSPLLSIHVCVIMIAYTLFAFIALNSISSLFMMRWGQLPDRGTDLSLRMLYPALFLLTAGIFIGAVWANVSWGRYWGWDPKEVWALITMIIYAMPMHRESIRWFRSPRNLHIYLVVAFFSVLITYFGVNFFLGGLHSYN